MNPQGQHFIGIDIGTSNVTCVIGAPNEDSDQISIVGAGQAVTEGSRKGVIISVEDTIEAMVKAMDQAERLSGIKVDHAMVSLDGAHIISLNSRGVIAVGGNDREIGHEDIDRAIEAATVIQLPPNREIVHVFPREFTLDGQQNIKDPMGMKGLRLEVETHIVTGSTPAIKNINTVFRQLAIHPEGLIVTVVAAAQAVLDKRQKEIGTAVVDIGGSTTSIAVFEEGEILHTAVVPLGSNHITNDIAIGLKMDLDTAEEIKVSHATADTKSHKTAGFSIKNADTKEIVQIDNHEVSNIVEARLDEIFDAVNDEFKRIKRNSQLPGGVVLTGGGAKLRGIDEFAKEHLGLPAVLGRHSKKFSGLIENVSDPSYITALGLVYEASTHGTRRKKVGINLTHAKGMFKGLLEKFKP